MEDDMRNADEGKGEGEGEGKGEGKKAGPKRKSRLYKALERFGGQYENIMYAPKDMNDWHFVMLHPTKNGYTWENKAGVKWSLTLQRGQDFNSDELHFDVGEDCPYFDTYKVAKLFQREGQTIIVGPGNEEYKLTN